MTWVICWKIGRSNISSSFHLNGSDTFKSVRSNKITYISISHHIFTHWIYLILHFGKCAVHDIVELIILLFQCFHFHGKSACHKIQKLLSLLLKSFHLRRIINIFWKLGIRINGNCGELNISRKSLLKTRVHHFSPPGLVISGLVSFYNRFVVIMLSSNSQHNSAPKVFPIHGTQGAEDLVQIFVKTIKSFGIENNKEAVTGFEKSFENPNQVFKFNLSLRFLQD